MDNKCHYCGKPIPDGRYICWACEYKYSGLHPNCVYYHNEYCLIKSENCTPLPCKWFKKEENE